MAVILTAREYICWL